ncbi:MAG: DegT/DnrJ/EryC1/StrS family aminotransferase [Bacteroidales bacterium]|nr:DegT/DnrJ/EryC1/StrS family aminotransferase [Bacteroidales bacterium]
MHSILMLDLASQHRKIQQELSAAMQEVIESNAFVKGSQISDFQHNLEKFLGVRNVIPVGNGTDALQIALMALGLQPGDEVILPSFTFVSTAEVVALLHLTPVFVDVRRDTCSISIESIERAITPRTRAIIPVHLFGQNADMEAILKVAQAHNIYVVEDACQSIAAEYTFANGEKTQSGCMGAVGCTSFFPSKNLGAFGDGGAIFTNDDTLAQTMRMIANHGSCTLYRHEFVGVNSRLDTLQAAVLNVKLRYLPEYTLARQTIANQYDSAFFGNPHIVIPARNSQSAHVFHQYTIQVKNGRRNELQTHLAQRGIPTRVYYPQPLHAQRAYSQFPAENCSVSEELCETVLSLPIHPELSEEQVQWIVQNVREILD